MVSAVGGPLFVNAVESQAPPLDEFVALTWNAHLAEGQLPELIAELKAGAFTDGRPVRHFALLVQELYRRGDEVPPFNDHDRTAFAISARDPKAADVEDHAAALGLSLLYVPSMRNGAELREDRGNAIISTEPLHNVMAIELPLARQRRVAIGASGQRANAFRCPHAAIDQRTPRAVERAAHAVAVQESTRPAGPRHPRFARIAAVQE